MSEGNITAALASHNLVVVLPRDGKAIFVLFTAPEIGRNKYYVVRSFGALGAYQLYYCSLRFVRLDVLFWSSHMLRL
jgi:hypothetical protein